MTYKGLVFFDLDGTLLDDKSQVSADNKRALDQLRQNGYLPIIATGRSIAELGDVLEQAEISSVVMMNGMAIYSDGKEVFSETIATETIEKLIKTARDLGEEIAYYTPTEIVLSGNCQGLTDHFVHFDGSQPQVDSDFYRTTAINMLLVGTADKSHDAIYHERVPELHFFRNSPYSIDVTKLGVDKGTGVAQMKQVLGLTDLPTYAFGDGLNDLPLLKAVDFPVAMANAVPEIKAAASYVTGHHLKDGIRQGLQHFGLI